MCEMLEARDIRFAYDEGGRWAVDGLSMQVKKGEYVAVLGANGCGKSTLAKHFNAILLPASGAVLVEGMPCLLYTSGHRAMMPALLLRGGEN